MKKHSNQDWKKNTDSTKSNCQVSNFSLEAFGTACFLNCESLHNLVVVFQDILHRKFDFLFIWKLKAKCSRVSQADLSPLSLCMGEGRFVAHFTFWILICIVHFFLLFAFQISNFAFAICIFSILHSVLCILYFAFCICIPTSWHFHHSAVWFTWFDTNLHYQAVRNIFFYLSEFFRMLPIICLHLWAARNLLQNRTNDKLKQFQTFFLKKFLRTSVNSIPKSGTNMKR